MSWKPEVEGIERRRALALEQGGAERVALQHERGKLSIRERIDGYIHEQGSVKVIGQCLTRTPKSLMGCQHRRGGAGGGRLAVDRLMEQLLVTAPSSLGSSFRSGP